MGLWLCPSSGASASEGCVAVQAAGQKLSGGLELVADESQSEEPGAHCVLGVLGLLGLGAGGADFLCHLAQCQAKLNVALELSGVEAVLLAVGRGVELEEAELDRALGEGGVEVEHMVAAVVVVLVSAVGSTVAGVPNVRQLCHGGGLLAVDLVKEGGVDHPAVGTHPTVVDCEGVGEELFVACHDVRQVAEGLRGVTLGSDVDVNTAASGGVALGSRLAELANQLLQGFHVAVGKDRGDHLALLAVGAVDAAVSLEFPFPTLGIPSAPGAVAVAVGGVLEAVSPEEVSCQLCGFLSGDVVHLDLDSDGLLLHFLNLSGYLCVHGVYLRFVCCPFRCTHIRSTSPI